MLDPLSQQSTVGLADPTKLAHERGHNDGGGRGGGSGCRSSAIRGNDIESYIKLYPAVQYKV